MARRVTILTVVLLALAGCEGKSTAAAGALGGLPTTKAVPATPPPTPTVDDSKAPAGFSQVGGLDSETDVVEYRDGEDAKVRRRRTRTRKP